MKGAGARWETSMGSDPRFVERSLPIRKTVLGAPPFMDRRLAPFANEPADIFARLPFLRGAVNRLARRATEIDANFVGIHHFAPLRGQPVNDLLTNAA